MKDLARKFVIDITEALKNGKDLNMMRKSSLGRDVGLEEEIDAEIIRIIIIFLTIMTEYLYLAPISSYKDIQVY